MIKTTVKLINLTENFEQLLAIWRACFPEDADFGEIFLKEAASDAEIFGVFQGEALVACAYCLPTDFYDGNSRFSAYYVYGVGTLPSHRGKGYAKQLLHHIQEAVSVDVLFLYPATPSLRTFYEALGYRSVLCRTEKTVSQNMGGDIPKYDMLPFDAQAYTAKRVAFLEGSNVSYAAFHTTVLQALLDHAELLLCENAAALCITEEKTVYIPEMLCEESYIPTVLAAVKKQFPDKQVVTYTAGTDTKSGMLLPCSKTAKKHFKNKKSIPFFGTFFAE